MNPARLGRCFRFPAVARSLLFLGLLADAMIHPSDRRW